jgi:Predicted membrane protein
MTKFIQTNAFTLKKTVSYYFTHIIVAVLVAYAVTGNWLISITLSLLEPSVQTVVYFFHERFWSRTRNKKTLEFARVSP